MKVLLMIAMILIVGLNVNAQNIIIVQDNESLIYIQIIDEQKIIVSQTADNIIYYPLASGECFAVSLDSRYIALSQEQPTTLKIIHLQSQKTIFETTWSSAWTPCSISWSKDDILLIYSQGILNSILKFENLTLNPIPRPQPIYPDLPYFTPILETGGTRNVTTFYLQNPVYPNIYLYDMCFIESLYTSEECPPYGPVIYDLSTDTILARVEILPTRIADFSVGAVPYIAVYYDIIGWSSNGRYLAFFDSINIAINEGQILIYDLQEDRYIEDRDTLAPFNFNHNILWSNNNTLLIWKTGYLLAEVSQYNDSLAIFTFYNPDTQTSVSSVDRFNVLRSEAVFSPDSGGLLIIGKPIVGYDKPVFDENPTRADLILISTITGESTVIDTNVTEIITWRSICDFTVSDATSLISTMQTEPYSVICLDENVTYTLTAPLPTITGDITIIGNGAQIVMTGTGRVFDVASTGGLTLKNITVSGGNAVQGGAIYNAGDVTLENVVLDNNSATDGGAIYNIGNLEMDGGAIQNNTATNFGGGIYNLGELDVDGVNIRDNDAVEGSGVYQGE